MSESIWIWLILAGSLLITNWIFIRYENKLDSQFKVGYQRGREDERRNRSYAR